MQGTSARSVFRGPDARRLAGLHAHRYFMHADNFHNAYADYGVRTHRYKLIYYYETEPVWLSGSSLTLSVIHTK